ncbi:MAG TPA: hypothetical protein PKW80_10030 [Bacteroidales bacterium]|nr:hypothetical protein [Bacteroidales bacterium]
MSVSNTHSKSLLFFIAVLIITGALVYWFRWTGNADDDWKSIIDGDGKRYYEYYEQVVFNKNFGNATPDYDNIIKAGDRTFIKGQCGTALLISPFFLTARMLSGFSDDPYSPWYHKSISVAALFYMLLGFAFLYMFLTRLNIKPVHIFFSLIAVLFATNLLVYTVIQPDVSHVYSFAMISCFLWASCCFIQKPGIKYLLISAVTFGIIYLIRPVNVIVIFFLPFFFDDARALRNFLKRHIKQMALFAIVALLIMGIQNVLWYIQCGHFFLWSYQNEGFYWLHPEFFNVLFSFRKGLFIYTPILILVFLSLAAIFKTNQFKFIIVVIFLFILTYIVSSWWCWTYFDSFGMRPFVDFYGIFVLLFAFLLHNLKKKFRIMVLILCIPFLLLNLVQSYQYRKNILSPEYMNFDSYKYIFLKTSDTYVNCIGGSYDLVPYNQFEKKLIFTASPEPGDDRIVVFDSLTEYSPGVKILNNSELFNAGKSFAEIRFKKWEYRVKGSTGAVFVVSISYAGRLNAFYKVFPLNYLPVCPVNQWTEYSYSMILPKISEPGYELTMYIWNKGLQEYKIKNLEINIYKTG